MFLKIETKMFELKNATAGSVAFFSASQATGWHALLRLVFKNLHVGKDTEVGAQKCPINGPFRRNTIQTIPVALTPTISKPRHLSTCFSKC